MVVGILIALQINTWNEHKKLREKERSYLIALKKEAEDNVGILKREIAQNEARLDTAAILAAIIDSPDRGLEEEELARMLKAIFSGISWARFREGTMREIMSSGSINIIQNESIKGFISSWEPTLEDMYRQEDWGMEFRDASIDLWAKDGSHRRIIAAVGRLELFNLTNRQKRKSNLWLLDSNEFENNLLLYIATLSNLSRFRYEPILKDLEAFIELIDQEIN